MGIATPPPPTSSYTIIKQQHHPIQAQAQAHKPDPNSMSQPQEYHPHQPHPHHHQQENIFAFSNGFDRSTASLAQQHDHQTQDPTTAATLHPVYETAGMLSEMFNFGQAGPGPAPSPEMVDYRRAMGGLGQDWYGGGVPRQHHQQQEHHQESDPTNPPHHHHQIPPSINADSAAAAAAMQLFLTNPPPRSPSPPQPPPPAASGSTLHMLLPSQNLEDASAGSGGGYHNIGSNPNFWSTHINSSAPNHQLGGVVEGQGLSLSLSSSLQHLEAAKQAEELRNMGGGGDGHHHVIFSSTPSPSAGHFFKNLQQNPHQVQDQQQIIHNLQGAFGLGPGPSSTATTAQHQVHIGFGSSSTAASSLGVVNALRNSKYAKPAQELLEEFCSVGRGHIKMSKLAKQNSVNPSTSGGGGGGGGGAAGSSSSTKDNPPPQLSAADRIEHQRRKVKLLSMLDEVERRYNHYCEQMQMVVNSFDLVMGYGAAIPFTALAQKAMSRHFRCLKDSIQAQLKHSCELLGEKDPTGSSGLTKGETPRLKLLEQSLRQQRAFHQMGMMEQEAWRPQRGLPERSVNILRAWLFEHFLHPYPSDADKHMLARQTGLSRNQVSNWFINARVRLWKPMVEEMYQQEAKELEDEERNQTSTSTSNTNNSSFATTQQQEQQQQQSSQNPMPPSSSASTTLLPEPKPVPPDSDPSLPPNTRPHQPPPPHANAFQPSVSQPYLQGGDTCHFDDSVGPATMIRFGNASGDVSLTLGLRHAGNAPEKSTAAAFSVRDFGSC